MVKHIATTDSFRKFVTSHWPSGEAQWFRNLARSGWVGADWPLEFGGTGWARQEQLHLVTTLSEYRCPLMPDSVNVIAPMLLAYGSTKQKKYKGPKYFVKDLAGHQRANNFFKSTQNQPKVAVT